MDTTLKAMRYFMAAVNCGSITEASKQLNVVPSAVLAAVNQVEESFGLQLTTRRRSKGISTTTTGKVLVNRIQHLLDEYETLMSEGVDLREKLTGTLRVGYYAPIAPAFIPQITSKLLNGNSGIDIKFINCDNHTAQTGLVSGEFDVILCVAESMKPDVTYETLTVVSPYVLAPANHLFAEHASVSIKRLAEQKLILLDLPVVSEYYGQIFNEVGMTPGIVCTATTVEMIRSLVGAGLGCSILHMRPMTDTSYAGQAVVSIPIDPPLKPLKIVLGHLPDNPRRLVKAFVEETRRYFATRDATKLLVNVP
ncbi:MAG: LysR family transcriptional regulator [Granulosicoccus sp.]